jgi:F0F1-type ATP synthase gamma subunit
MRNKRQINSALGELANFESLTETFTEIAATRMQRVRDGVVKSRDFVSGINVIFGEVKANYEQEIAALKRATITNNRKNNGKTAVVFISANTGLYGDIVKRIFYTFLEDVKTHQADAIIIGKVGQKMLEDEGKDIIPITSLAEIKKYL